MLDTGLKRKTVLITGANHGIGAAIAIAFAREKANVFLTYLRLSPEKYGGLKEEEAEGATEPGRHYYYKILKKSTKEVERKILELGGECFSQEADLSNPDNIPFLFDEAEERFGAVNILVNNAAFDLCDTFLPSEELKKNPLFVDAYPKTTLTAGSCDAHFAVNSRAVALMIKEFAGRFIARKGKWGKVVNITTDGAWGHASNVSYGASKLAVESYTRAAAVELGPYGITVNVVSPGAVQTGWMPTELKEELEKSYPLRRVGKPDDIANAVVFFASKQADWITGQVLQVGGGNRM